MSLPVIASVKSEIAVANGAGFKGSFNTIWVGASGNIAISRDNGATFRIYFEVPVGFHNVKASVIGTTAQGTTAADLLACSW